MQASFSVTERAAARIAELAGPGQQSLRVNVLSGGCSGFQYQFELTEGTEPDDVIIERGGARVLIDPASLELLAGSELDFKDELMGAYFAVKNPQATSSCGCGTSFAID
jgi:iron-sulfur cluster insertion protein